MHSASKLPLWALLFAPLVIMPNLACAGPEVYEVQTIRVNGQDFDADDDEVQDVRIEVRNFADDVDLEIEDVSGRLVDGRMAAQFRLVNEEDETLRLRLTWQWRDADGILLRAGAYERAEKSLVLQPREERIMPFTSPTESAIQFIASINHTDTDR